MPREGVVSMGPVMVRDGRCACPVHEILRAAPYPQPTRWPEPRAHAALAVHVTRLRGTCTVRAS